MMNKEIWFFCVILLTWCYRVHCKKKGFLYRVYHHLWFMLITNKLLAFASINIPRFKNTECSSIAHLFNNTWIEQWMEQRVSDSNISWETIQEKKNFMLKLHLLNANS